MNTSLSLVAIALQGLSFDHFRLECIKLSGKELTLSTRLILLLLGVLASTLQQFYLLGSLAYFGLPDFYRLQSMFVSLGERDQPLPNLLKEPIGFF